MICEEVVDNGKLESVITQKGPQMGVGAKSKGKPIIVKRHPFIPNKLGFPFRVRVIQNFFYGRFLGILVRL